MLPTRIFSVPSNRGPVVGVGVGDILLDDLGMGIVGRADDDRGADWLAVDLEVVHEVFCPPWKPMALEGSVQTCLRSTAIATVTYQPGCRWPSELGMSIDSVWSVRVDGLSEKPDRTTLSFTRHARNRLKADDGRVLIVNKVGGQFGNAHEYPDRVDLLEHEQKSGRPLLPPPGWKIVARTNVALGDHALEGALIRPYSTTTLASRSSACATIKSAAGGLDVDLRSIAIGNCLVERISFPRPSRSPDHAPPRPPRTGGRSHHGPGRRGLAV